VPKRLIAAVAALLLLAACGGAPSSSSPRPGGPQPPSGSTGASSGPPRPSPAGKAKGIPFAIGYPAASSHFIALFVGVDKGFFAENGLDARLKLLRGSSSETSALVSGSIRTAIIEATAALAPMGRGVQTVFVGNDLNAFPMALWTKPSVTSVAQLKGHTLGLEHVNSLTDAGAHEVLPKLGLDLSTVHLAYLGAPASLTAGLIAGRVDAAVDDPPSMFELARKGYRVLVDFRKYPHVSGGIVMARSFAQGHPNEAQDFLRGYVQAIAYTKDPAHRAEVLKILSKYTQITDPKVLQESYDFSVPLLQSVPAIAPSDLADAVAWVEGHDHVRVDAANVVDTAPMDALKASGFLRPYGGS
jgi:NitT/TauT family transport system substrate-binding protein